MHSTHTPTQSLDGKIAMVVGASSGLGKHVARLLAEERAKVFALSRSITTADLPGSVARIPVNVRDLASIDAAWTMFDAQSNRLDLLINCAGRRLVRKLEETTREEIMDILGTNLKGNVYMVLEAYKRMKPKRSGHIINVSSTSGVKPRPNETIYAASKWGLRGFTESLRMEAAPHRVRISGVYPGGMNTDFWKGEKPKDIDTFMDPADVAEQLLMIAKSPESISPSEYVIERGAE
jgi:uncharacterized protein